MKVEWRDLEDKGYLVVPQFLSAGEIELVRSDYKRNAPRKNGNYDRGQSSAASTKQLQYATQSLLNDLDPKIQLVSELVLSATGIDTDVTIFAAYWAIDRGINTPWHQDHESYFIFQEHRHHLNFYIPIIKPNAAELNLCVVPFDRLQKKGPEFYSRLKGGGASRFLPNGSQTTVIDDETDGSYRMPFDIAQLAVTPNLSAGDLLLLRGDTIHRTQDTNTPRVAISFRRISTKGIIRHSKFMKRGWAKREVIRKSAPLYDKISQCFTNQNRSELSVGEVLPHIQSFLRGEFETPRS